MTEPVSQYDDRMLDSLGSQRYTEQQMLYMRKVKDLEHQLDELEEKRKALESSIGLNQLEAGKGSLQASDSEAVRMTDFASATQASQTRIAQETAGHAVKQSLIENDRDRKLMEAELEANRKLAVIDQQYSASIKGAQSDSERNRINNELETEKIKAEARRKKALIEADTTRDISRLEQSYQDRILSAKQSDAAVTRAAAMAHSQESQKQRIKVAIANADAQRRVKDDISASMASLSGLQAEKISATQAYRDELTKLNERIIALQGKIDSIEAGYDSKISIEKARLDGLQDESRQLAEVGQDLINDPVSDPATDISQGLSSAAARGIQQLEAELLNARNELLARKANRLAEVDQQLAQDLDRLSAKLSAGLSSLAGAGNETTARIERASGESAIRAELAAKKTQITNDARSQLAELTVKTEIAKAGVVAPVVTGRAVYSGGYGPQPEAFAARESNAARTLVAKAKEEIQPGALAKSAPIAPPIRTVQMKEQQPSVEPILIVSQFEPRHKPANRNQVEDVVIATGAQAGGDLSPLVIAPTATTYSVVYRYAEKGTAEKFMAFLRAWGVNDFTYRYSEKLGQHILFMGKYTSKEKAASRVAFLNKTTNTANADIIETDL